MSVYRDGWTGRDENRVRGGCKERRKEARDEKDDDEGNNKSRGLLRWMELRLQFPMQLNSPDHYLLTHARIVSTANRQVREEEDNNEEEVEWWVAGVPEFLQHMFGIMNK